MRYLLDTHIALWVLNGEAVSDKAKEILDDVTTEIYVSIASAWEIAVKISIGKLQYHDGVRAFLDDIKLNGFELIGVETSHVVVAERLEYHHRDPFDRLLISTAIAEDMTFISADKNVHKYDVLWLW